MLRQRLSEPRLDEEDMVMEVIGSMRKMDVTYDAEGITDRHDAIEETRVGNSAAEGFNHERGDASSKVSLETNDLAGAGWRNKIFLVELCDQANRPLVVRVCPAYRPDLNITTRSFAAELGIDDYDAMQRALSDRVKEHMVDCIDEICRDQKFYRELLATQEQDQDRELGNAVLRVRWPLQMQTASTLVTRRDWKLTSRLALRLKGVLCVDYDPREEKPRGNNRTDSWFCLAKNETSSENTGKKRKKIEAISTLKRKCT